MSEYVIALLVYFIGLTVFCILGIGHIPEHLHVSYFFSSQNEIDQHWNTKIMFHRKAFFCLQQQRSLTSVFLPLKNQSRTLGTWTHHSRNNNFPPVVDINISARWGRGHRWWMSGNNRDRERFWSECWLCWQCCCCGQEVQQRRS